MKTAGKERAHDRPAGGQLPYDFLVVATGPRLSFEEVPGLGPQGHADCTFTLDTVKMAKVAAAAIAAEVRGSAPPPSEELGVVCLMDMGHTAAIMKAYPVLPPRQDSYMKQAVWAKWMKLGFERYFLWKMRRGLSGLP